MKYAVVIEPGETSFGAHVAELPGCVAVGETRDEVLKLIEEAIEFRIEGLREDGLPIPAASSSVEFVEAPHNNNRWVGDRELVEAQVTQPEISSVSPFFIVQDATAALSFYRDQLGSTSPFRNLLMIRSLVSCATVER